VTGVEKEEEGIERREGRDAKRLGPQEPGLLEGPQERALLIEAADPCSVWEAGELLALAFVADGYNATDYEVHLAMAEASQAIQTGRATVLFAWSLEPGAWSRPPPIGMIEVREMSGPPLGRHYQMGRLVVVPSHRGSGRVARTLILGALSVMQDETLPILAMTVGRAIPRSYGRLGAIKIGEVAAGSVREVKRRLYGKRGASDRGGSPRALLGGVGGTEPEAGGARPGGDRQEPDPAI